MLDFAYNFCSKVRIWGGVLVVGGFSGIKENGGNLNFVYFARNVTF